MPALVELGLVERREAPPSALFKFVPDHVAARAVTALGDAGRTVLEELNASAIRLKVAPVSVIVFGSFARGEADRSSLDVLLIRSPQVGEEDTGWRAAIDGWVKGVRRLTGNRVELLEVGVDEARAKFRSKNNLWTDIQRDGIVVFGREIAELRGRRSA